MTDKTKSSANWKIYWIYLIPLVLLASSIFPTHDKQVHKYYLLGKAIRANKEAQVKRNKAELKKFNKFISGRNFSKGIEYAKKASTVRIETQYLLNWIDSLENELISKTGGIDTNIGGAYIGAAISVNDIMVGKSSMKKGKGYELKRRLDNWVSFMQKNGPVNNKNNKIYVQIPSMAMNGLEDEFYSKEPENKSKDFAELNFGKAVPLAAAIALLEKKAYEIAYLEGLVIEAYNPENIGCIWMPQITTTYQSSSQTLFAGSEYKASIFLTPKWLEIKSSVIFNGDTNMIEEDSSAKIKFIASGGNYDENGLIKKYWTAKVEIPDHKGSYSYKEIKGDYYVYKPIVLVKAEVATAMYEQCANMLTIKASSLGADFRPTFSCNAPTRKGKTSTELIVVPKSKEAVRLKIYNNEIFLDSSTFKVMPVPLPSFQIYANNSAINPKLGIKKNTKRLSLKVLPDKGFASLFPNEVNYSFGKMQVSLYTGNKLSKSFDVSNAEIPLPKSKADRIVIEVLKLYRTNSLGKKTEVNLRNEGILSVYVIE